MLKEKRKPNEIWTVEQARRHFGGFINIPQKKSNIKASITQALKDSKLPYVTEYKFSKDRKYRFDWAIITTHCKIGIEYDGLMSAKSRHITITGFSKDQEKFNLAALEGWIVLRYSALNYKQLIPDVLKQFK